MNPAETEWEGWAAEWRALSPPIAPPGELRARVEREHRRLRRARAAEAALALAVVAGVGLAVAHAPAPEDLARGAVVVALVLLVAALRLRPGALEPLDAEPTAAFLELSLRGCRWRLRGVRCAWLLLALALGFLVPWWIDGYRLHGDATGALAVVSAWLPAAAIAGVFAWTLRLHSRLRSELASLEERQRALLRG